LTEKPSGCRLSTEGNVSLPDWTIHFVGNSGFQIVTTQMDVTVIVVGSLKEEVPPSDRRHTGPFPTSGFPD
jgi:hypothetical protein